MSITAYRKDIDGLRAIAILAVLGFHFFPTFVPGGFAGVDIFFVISGFLISNIIFTQLNDHSFSFRDFYSRRAKRIFPALITVLFVCYILGWLILLDDEFKELGKYIFGSCAFISNILLWRQSGYFDTATHTKPLMHLWSLSIEEQFYIVWPLLIYVIGRTRFNRFAIMLSILSASFVLCLILSYQYQVTAFYLPMTRFWELLIGCMLAHLECNHTVFLKSSRLRGCFGWLGIVLIAIAISLIDKEKIFPGWWALLPTLGAVMVIAADPTAWVNHHILSNRALVWVGLISYPLYLWHWPLLAYSHVLLSISPSYEVRFAILLLSFLLAWLTFKFIEKPIRFGAASSLKTAKLCTTLAFCATIGIVNYIGNGLPFRNVMKLNFNIASTMLGSGQEFVSRTCGLSPEEQKYVYFCSQDIRNTPHYAVLGDSKADALYWGLVRNSTPDARWLIIAKPGCAPMYGAERVTGGSEYSPKECAAANRIGINAIATNPNIKAVLLVVSEKTLSRDSYATTANSIPSDNAVFEGFNGLIDRMRKAGKKVIFFIDTPYLPDPKECMHDRVTGSAFINQFLWHRENPKCTFSYKNDWPKPESYIALVKKLRAANKDVLFYDPTPLVCDTKAKSCAVRTGANFYYSYGEHLSDYGNTLIAKDLLPRLIN